MGDGATDFMHALSENMVSFVGSSWKCHGERRHVEWTKLFLIGALTATATLTLTLTTAVRLLSVF